MDEKSQESNVTKTDYSESTREFTKLRYDEEIQRRQHIENKSSTQIGFSGTIISILAFAIGSYAVQKDPAPDNAILSLAIFGVSLLLLSIVVAIIATSLNRKVPTISPEIFHEMYGDKSNDEQKNLATSQYFRLIKFYSSKNNRLSFSLMMQNIIMLIGLAISFIALFLTMM